jgi:hypothetical protein
MALQSCVSSPSISVVCEVVMKVLRPIMTICDLNYGHGHCLLNNTLQFVITKTCEVHDEIVSVVGEEAKAFDKELTNIMIHMKHQMLEALQPFFFLHGFDKEKGHNIFALMLETRFKNMWLVANYFQVVKIHLRWSMNMILVYCCFCQWIITRC